MTKDGTPLPEPKFRNTFLRGNECFYDYFSAVLSEEKAAHKRGAAKAAPRQNSKLPAKESDRYLKVVEWSDEDQKYIGTCLELFGGGCHGKDEAKVYKELCGIVDWVIEDEKKDGDPLPEPTLRKKIAGKFFTLLCATTSEKNARRVSYPSESLNNYCVLREEAAVYNPGPAPKARKTKALKSNPKAQR
jgi:predicted RNase H-like HicB family nuclease